MKHQAKKIIVFGGSGLLGKEFVKIFAGKKHDVFSPSSRNVDITNILVLRKFFKKIRPDIVVNCAALINVDWGEKHPYEVWGVNTFGAANIAKALAETCASKAKQPTLVQVSTSDVFGGLRNRGKQKLFYENDPPAPVNVYGWSKLAAEEVLKEETMNSGIKLIIIRAGWLYGEGRNTFVDIMAECAVSGERFDAICDQFNFPVFTSDLANTAAKLVFSKTQKEGIYHITSKGAPPSRLDIFLEIAKILGVSGKGVAMVKAGDIFKVPRPVQAALGSRKFPLIDWRKSLKKYLLIKYGGK